jgi:phosphoadenosine phosphosulfate reductase
VFTPNLSSAWSQARHGELWQEGVEGIRRYNEIHKVEPMQRALKELDVRTWFAGLRRVQSDSRAGIEFLELRDGRWKVHPLADWSDRDIWQYLHKHDLPYHPLWHQGYVSIGDVHSTQPLQVGMLEQDTRFNGLLRECGLHI